MGQLNDPNPIGDETEKNICTQSTDVVYEIFTRNLNSVTVTEDIMVEFTRKPWPYADELKDKGGKVSGDPHLSLTSSESATQNDEGNDGTQIQEEGRDGREIEMEDDGPVAQNDEGNDRETGNGNVETMDAAVAACDNASEETGGGKDPCKDVDDNGESEQGDGRDPDDDDDSSNGNQRKKNKRPHRKVEKRKHTVSPSSPNKRAKHGGTQERKGRCANTRRTSMRAAELDLEDVIEASVTEHSSFWPECNFVG